jgi:hypothetical protein
VGGALGSHYFAFMKEDNTGYRDGIHVGKNPKKWQKCKEMALSTYFFRFRKRSFFKLHPPLPD